MVNDIEKNIILFFFQLTYLRSQWTPYSFAIFVVRLTVTQIKDTQPFIVDAVMYTSRRLKAIIR